MVSKILLLYSVFCKDSMQFLKNVRNAAGKYEILGWPEKNNFYDATAPAFLASRNSNWVTVKNFANFSLNFELMLFNIVAYILYLMFYATVFISCTIAIIFLICEQIFC